MNILAKFNDPRNPNYHKVHIRGVCFNISSSVINSLLGCPKSSSLGEAHPFTEDLVMELIGDTKSAWPSSGQLSAASLSANYVILHKIGITNWCPTTHGSGLSPTLTSLLYQISTRSTFNYGVFVFNQLLRHVDTFTIKVSTSFLCLFCGISMSQYYWLQSCSWS